MLNAWSRPPVHHDEVAAVQDNMVGRERAARAISPANTARALQLWGLVDRGLAVSASTAGAISNALRTEKSSVPGRGKAVLPATGFRRGTRSVADRR
jgi:hypothetical protein